MLYKAFQLINLKGGQGCCPILKKYLVSCTLANSSLEQVTPFPGSEKVFSPKNGRKWFSFNSGTRKRGGGGNIGREGKMATGHYLGHRSNNMRLFGKSGWLVNNGASLGGNTIKVC